MSAGILYIVPTPVGNLEDMTIRAIKVLREADIILAEDTRTSSVLLKHFGISGKLLPHHKFNEHRTVQIIKDKIASGANVALISDAGTPGISDPGFLLARACAEEGISVSTLPGATACHRIFRTALRQILFRRLPSHQERQDDTVGKLNQRNKDYDILRITAAPVQDSGAICGVFRG